MKFANIHSSNINWLKYSWLYFAISFAILIPGIFGLIRWGLKLSIEFTGGSQYAISQTVASPSAILNNLSVYNPIIVSTDTDYHYVRSQFVTQSEVARLISPYSESTPAALSIVEQYEVVGSTIGRETLQKTLNALIIATILLLLFISTRFNDFLYGLSAIIATLHDSLIVIGTFAILGHIWGIEIDTLFVTAVLTILSFSLHDTIVVFDRIREIKSKNSTLAFADVANRAISETFVRSFNNSLTMVFALLAIFALGGDSTRYFSLALLIGTVVGTYSSMFTAIPILNLIHKYKK
jgi:preprotein translocase subunit SecF